MLQVLFSVYILGQLMKSCFDHAFIGKLVVAYLHASVSLSGRRATSPPSLQWVRRHIHRKSRDCALKGKRPTLCAVGPRWGGISSLIVKYTGASQNHLVVAEVQACGA